MRAAEPKSVLSPLEQDALSLLWKHQRMKVRDIYHILRPKKKIALSSIAVILDRLYEKGIVGREVESARGGLRYIYFPRQDKQTFERTIIERSVDALIETFGKNAVSYFNERFRK